MDTMNLDCDSYSTEELIELLGLTDNYSNSDLQNKRRVLEDQLKKRNDLGVEKQRQIIFFLDNVLSKLSNISHKNNNPTPGSWASQTNNVIQEGSHFIIANQNEMAGKRSIITTGRNAMSMDAPPGYINPINVRSIIQAINVDTRFRPDYYKTRSTDFNVKLPYIQKRVVGLRVGAIEIPMTYHSISRGQGNNTMLIIDGAAPIKNENAAWLLTLPDGNYEMCFQDQSGAFSIETAMNDAIDAAVQGTVDATTGRFTPNATPPPPPPTLTGIRFDANRISGRSVFALIATSQFANTGFILRFNVDNDGNLDMDTNIQLRLGWQLGFRVAQYKGRSAVSEGICAISGPRYAFLSIDDHQKNVGNSFIAAFANSSMDSNIITRINLSAVMDDVGVYKGTNDPGLNNQLNRSREYFGPVDIMNLTVKLLDEYGRIIDLNNMDWSFSLSFEKLYD